MFARQWRAAPTSKGGFTSQEHCQGIDKFDDRKQCRILILSFDESRDLRLDKMLQQTTSTQQPTGVCGTLVGHPVTLDEYGPENLLPSMETLEVGPTVKVHCDLVSVLI